MPCAIPGTLVTPPHASLCTACEQGAALMHFCSDAGLLVMSGRVTGDEPAYPTCYAGTPSVIDLFIASPGLRADPRPHTTCTWGDRGLLASTSSPTSPHPPSQHVRPADSSSLSASGRGGDHLSPYPLPSPSYSHQGGAAPILQKSSSYSHRSADSWRRWRH